MTMRKTIVPILVFCLLVPLSGYGQRKDTASDHTLGFLNGRIWKAMSPAGKTAYLAGFYDGVIAGKSEVFAEKIVVKNAAGKTYESTLTPRELMIELDTFYLNTANVLIPIPFAIQYVARKSKNEKQKELDKFLNWARKASTGI